MFKKFDYFLKIIPELLRMWHFQHLPMWIRLLHFNITIGICTIYAYRIVYDIALYAQYVYIMPNFVLYLQIMTVAYKHDCSETYDIHFYI